MNLKNKLKSYSFWISLISALLIVVRIIGEHFNWFINESFIMDIVTAVCGVLVLLGILSTPSSGENGQTNLEELEQQSKEIQNKQKQTNSQIKEDIMAEQLTIQQQIEMLKKNLNTDKSLEQESSEVETKEDSKDVGQSETETQDMQASAQNGTLAQNLNVEDNYGLEIVAQSLESEIIQDHAKMETSEVSQEALAIEDCASEQVDLGAINDFQTGNLEDNVVDENKTAIDDVQIDEKEQCNNIQLEINEKDINGQSDAMANEQNKEDLLNDVLSTLDKSQLKSLLIEILMRL